MDFRNLCSLRNEGSLKKYFNYLRNFPLIMGPENLVTLLKSTRRTFHVSATRIDTEVVKEEESCGGGFNKPTCMCIYIYRYLNTLRVPGL